MGGFLVFPPVHVLERTRAPVELRPGFGFLEVSGLLSLAEERARSERSGRGKL
jgi:hypothetical protein